MTTNDQRLSAFLDAQARDFGAKVEIDSGLWALLAVPATDPEANDLARSLLAEAPFPHDSGESEDGQWTLHYVDTAHRAEAIHWLDDQCQIAAGRIRPVSPAQRSLLAEVGASSMPHRLAQKLCELHAAGEVSAGLVREPATVRALLDRLHLREPLFFSAFHALLTHHLIDMLVLHQQMIAEDVGLENEIVKGSLSRDPFLQTRQSAAAEIRQFLMLFQIINPIDQLKNTSIRNPYAVHLTLVGDGDQLTLPVDGLNRAVPRAHFLAAIHATRRSLYHGGRFADFDTRVPWMTEEIAHSFRFLKQRLDSRRDLSPLDGLYMLERAVEV